MRYLPFLFILFLSLSACTKEEDAPDIIIDPPMARIISSDTLRSGQQWGLAIGESAPAIYSKVQGLQSEKNFSSVNVVGNVFTSIDSLQNRIPLYTSIYLDETQGTGSGIQIYFSDNKVKSIWTNDGLTLNKWPATADKNATIATGDDITGIYQKLVNIKRTSFAKKLERISVFSKDLNSLYDPVMSRSRQWYFSWLAGDKQFYVIQLNFEEGSLVSIYSSLYE